MSWRGGCRKMIKELYRQARLSGINYMKEPRQNV